jgi:thioredoxin reductase
MQKENNTLFDVIIVGGSYAGLSAAMSLGRSRRKVLVIDGGDPDAIEREVLEEMEKEKQAGKGGEDK